MQLGAVGITPLISENDSYLMLLIHNTTLSVTNAIPEPFYGILESLTMMMTPRGLRTSVSSNMHSNE
jgi:hypothetical protein